MPVKPVSRHSGVDVKAAQRDVLNHSVPVLDDRDADDNEQTEWHRDRPCRDARWMS